MTARWLLLPLCHLYVAAVNKLGLAGDAVVLLPWVKEARNSNLNRAVTRQRTARLSFGLAPDSARRLHPAAYPVPHTRADGRTPGWVHHPGRAGAASSESKQFLCVGPADFDSVRLADVGVI